jgi:hypothetical protein
MVIIGRPINGVNINGLEWLLDDLDEPMRFTDGNEARLFLLANEETAENIYSYWFEDEKTCSRLNIE